MTAAASTVKILWRSRNVYTYRGKVCNFCFALAVLGKDNYGSYKKHSLKVKNH